MATVEKKDFTYREADPQQRAIYLDEIKKHDVEKIVYLDESHVESQPYEYGWGKIGEKVSFQKEGRRGEKVNLIAGLLNGRLMCLQSFKINCNADYFVSWLVSLLSMLKSGFTIVMDNARFHHNKRVREVIEKAGCRLLYLPPYSPDLNPIEHCWHVLKNAIRKRKRNLNLSISEAVNQEVGNYLN